VGETWLTLREVAALTGKSRRWIFKQAAKGKIITREAPTPTRGGIPGRQFSLSSLPRAAQLKYAEQLGRQPGAIVVPADAVLEKRDVSPSSIVVAPKRGIVPEKLQPLVNERLAAIEPLTAFHKLAKRAERHYFLRERAVRNVTELAAAVGREKKKSARTLLRWFALYKDQGEVGLAGRIRGDRGKSRFFEEQPTARALVEKKFLVEGLSVELAWESLRREWPALRAAAKDDPPSYNTVRRHLRAIPLTTKTFAEEGERKFLAKCAPHLIRTKQPAMRWWVLDHRVHDVFVYNTLFAEQARAAIYRPWMTCVLDWGSRRVMGVIWAPTPSSRTISAAIRMAVAGAGFPGNFYWDNGKDFQAVGRALMSDELRHILDSQKVGVTNARSFSAQSKPIEPFFTLFSKRFDIMWKPAYCGRKPDLCSEACRGAQKHHKLFMDGKATGTNLPSDRNFIEGCLQFIEEYNAAPQERLGQKSPNEILEEQCPEAARKPVDRSLLHQLFWQRDARVVGRGGCVQLNRMTYEPKEEFLGSLGHLQGRGVTVARDPYDLREAVAFDGETGEFLGELQVQLAVEMTPGGKLSVDAIKEGDKRKRTLLRASRAYIACMEAIAADRGWPTESEALLERARGVRTGTDSRVLDATPGAGAQLPAAPQRALSASPFISDAAREDAALFADLVGGDEEAGQ
jgi:transposase InsO family protein